jgi:hypothetical protein
LNTSESKRPFVIPTHCGKKAPFTRRRANT